MVPHAPQSIEEAKLLLEDWGLTPESGKLNLTKRVLFSPPPEKCSCHKPACKTCFEFKILKHVYRMSQKNPNWMVTLTVDKKGGYFKSKEHAREEFKKYKKSFLKRIERMNEGIACSPDTVFEEGEKSGRNYHIHMVTRCDYFSNMDEYNDPGLLKDWKHATGHKKGCRVHIRVIRDVYVLTYLLANYDGTRKYLWLSKSDDLGSQDIPFIERRRSNPKLKESNAFFAALRCGDREAVASLKMQKLIKKKKLKKGIPPHIKLENED